MGTKTPGVDVKLSDGDEGEILVRGPYMFAKYLNDPEATKKVFNEEGYFKTGDIARRVKDKYFILGRSSIDSEISSFLIMVSFVLTLLVIKSGGYKISAIDIENAITKLPKVAEAMVVGVEDVEYGQRIAAAIVLKNVSTVPLQEAVSHSLMNAWLMGRVCCRSLIPTQLANSAVISSKACQITSCQPF